MDSTDSLADFFYNVVPGAVFLFFLDFIHPLPLSAHKTDWRIFIFLVGGLFIGFVFQGFSRFFSKKKWLFSREDVFNKVIENDPDAYNEVLKVLRIKEPKSYDKLRNLFHKIDNYLRGKPQSVIINHFAAKAAFWSNIFWGTIIMVFYYSFFYSNIFVQLSCILGFLFAYNMSKEYWISQYDVVMKTFFMVVVWDKEKSKKKVL